MLTRRSIRSVAPQRQQNAYRAHSQRLVSCRRAYTSQDQGIELPELPESNVTFAEIMRGAIPIEN